MQRTRIQLILKIALRNQRRNLRRTLLTLSSIAFGLASILWLQCVLNARTHELVETVTSVQTGHAQVTRKDYLRDKLPQQHFEMLPEAALGAFPPGTASSPRTRWGAMVSSGEQSMPVSLEGIEPESEARITIIKDRVVQGSYLVPEPSAECPSRQILIGKPIADLLNVEVGSKVIVLGAAADGTLGNDLFRVQGIYDTGSREFDKAMAFAPIQCVRRISLIPGVHEVVLKLADSSKVPEAIRLIEPALPKELSAISWIQAQPRFAMVLKYNDATVAMLSVLLFVVIAFGIMNTLFVSIFERTREFGLMIALGSLPAQVYQVILGEALMMGLVSSAAGTLLGSLAVLYHHYQGLDLRPFIGDLAMMGQFQLSLIIHPNLELRPFMGQIVGVNLVIVLASLIPALRAARLNPVETLRGT